MSCTSPARPAREESGWTEYDQLALQLIASEDLAGFSGDLYDDLPRFKQDLEGSTKAVLDYYDDTLNRQHILTELAVTSPAKKTYTTFEQTVTFMGASDPVPRSPSTTRRSPPMETATSP